MLGHGGLGVLVDGGAQNIEELAECLWVLVGFRIRVADNLQ